MPTAAASANASRPGLALWGPLMRQVCAQEEGIVVKDPSSLWVSDNRGKAWLKFKPEYAIALDMDAVVMAVQYGKGSRGAGADGDLFGEFIMGLRTSRGRSSAHRFVSFCRRAPHAGPACCMHGCSVRRWMWRRAASRVATAVSTRERLDAEGA